MAKEQKYDRGSSGVHSIVGEGSVFEGNIAVEGSLRVDGVFKGSIKCDAFYVGRTAEITAEIDASRSVIGGKVYGNLKSPMEVIIEESAEFIGDIETGQITVAEKSVFNGSIDMGKNEAYKNRLSAVKGKPAAAKPAADSE